MRKNILIVEDSAVQAMLMREAITASHMDVSVFVTSSIGETREFLKSGVVIDRFIVDVGLPDGDGASLAKELREAYPGSVVTLVSASPSSPGVRSKEDIPTIMEEIVQADPSKAVITIGLVKSAIVGAVAVISISVTSIGATVGWLNTAYQSKAESDLIETRTHHRFLMLEAKASDTAKIHTIIEKLDTKVDRLQEGVTSLKVTVARQEGSKK